MKLKSAILLCFFTAAVPSFANTIADWTFETSQPTTTGLFSPEVGSGSASGSHANASTGWSSPVGNGSAHSFSANDWGKNDYWQFSVSTVGFQSIQLNWDQASSSTGPADFALFYSTDGSSFTLFTDYTVMLNPSSPSTWNSSTAHPEYSFADSLSSITDLNNVSTVYFRLVDEGTVSAGGGTVSGSGTDRVDNFTVTGTVRPEHVPDSLPVGFSAAAILGLLTLSRRFYSRAAI